MRSLRRCRGLAASLSPRCLAALPRRAADAPPHLSAHATRCRALPVDAHAAPSARRRAAIVAVAPKQASRALPSHGPRPDFITVRYRRHQPARCALTRLQGRLASTPPPGRAHAAATLLLRPSPFLPSSPSPFASPKGVPPSHSAPLSFPSRAKPPQSQNALPPRHCRRRSSSPWSPYPRCPSVQIEPRNGTSSPR